MKSHEPGSGMEVGTPPSRFRPLNFDNGADWNADLLIRIDQITPDDINQLRNLMEESFRQKFDLLPPDEQMRIAVMATLTLNEWETIATEKYIKDGQTHRITVPNYVTGLHDIRSTMHTLAILLKSQDPMKGINYPYCDLTPIIR